MNYLKKLMCFGLVVVMTCTTGLPVYASNNKEISAMTGEISVLTGEITNIETPTDSTINYTEQRQDGLYYITENVNGNTIESTIYKMEGEEKIFNSSISSTIQEGQITCIETNADGASEQYTISTDIINLTQLDENLAQSSENETFSSNKIYLRTEKYGISLVGKNVTIAIAAAAIVAATAYVSLAVAKKIVIAAIGAGAGGGVASLPNYLYVTSKVYKTKSTGKIYTRYENKYYLNSKRTQYVGSWSFSKRWGH